MKRFIFFLLILSIVPLAALPKLSYSAASAILPGTGELALGKTTRGAIMLSTDILVWSSFFALEKEKDNLTDTYKQYAVVYAGAKSGMPESYYQNLQNYISSDDFNRYEELFARNYYLIYSYNPEGYEEYILANTYSDEESWSWQNQTYQDHYKKLRRRTQKAKIYQNLSIGALVLNRVVSVIDVSLINKKTNRPLSIYFTPTSNNGLMFNVQLEY
ncbi:MAG TPA: hypothetical protein PKH17_06755 [Candidatus Syntrophosphaera sp.]|nr:MAG: hypothetical protein BWY18_00260 [Candidatus Cloacimonetes bacterium ADurb.Bin211]HOD60425.1 hypothetical protein [Candidatus Syntrophosphaera sp.]